MRFKYFFYLTVFYSLLSCGNLDDEPINYTPQENFSKGIFILNEGNFMTPNASLSYYHPDTQELQKDVYSQQNHGNVLGDVAQSLLIQENRIFIAVNNSNKIVVLDRKTFKEIATITEHINQPRYLAYKDHYLFVTNATTQEVSVYDGIHYSLVKRIPTSKTPEHIVATQNNIAVQLSYFDTGNKIAFINPQTFDIDKEITLKDKLNSLAYNAEQDELYALCRTSGDNTLYKINPTMYTIKDQYTLHHTKNANKLTIDNGLLYFVDGNKVYHFDKLLNEEQEVFEVEDNSWSTFYGFNVINDTVYSSDAKGFVASGEVSTYLLSGKKIHTFSVGIGPNGFYPNR